METIEMLRMEQLVIKSTYMLFFLLFSCKKSENYNFEIHYQYVVYKKNIDNDNMRMYLENFLYLSNNSDDTIKIKTKDIINKYKVIYKKDTLNLKFVNNEDVIILPKKSIDLNCIADIKKISSYYPQTNADSLHYKIYDVINKKFLKRTKDYEIMNTKKFMIYNLESETKKSPNMTL